MRDGGAGQPGRVGGEDPGWQVGQRPAGPVGEDLLHDRVVAVLGLGLDQLDRDQAGCAAGAEPQTTRLNI
jgi:hypothetical protein